LKRLAGLALVLAVTASACGSGTSDAGLATLDEPGASDAGIASLAGPDAIGTADEPAVELGSEEAMFALAGCLREQGFDVQDPEVDDDGLPRLRSMFGSLFEEGEVDRRAIGVALAACSEFLDAITTQFERPDRSEIEDQLYEYAACMRDNGFEMADPDFSGEPGQGQAGGPFAGVDRGDPEFLAAHAVCEDLFVGGPGGGPGGGRRG